MAAPKKKWPLLKARYLEHLKVLGFAERTIEGHESYLRYFLEYLEKETKVQDLSELAHEDLAAYQTWLYYAKSRRQEDRPLGLSAQAERLMVVQVFFRYLFKEGFLLYDPAASLEKPKCSRSLPRGILDPPQVLALLKTPDVRTPIGIRDRAMLELFYATGIRNTELITLRVRDLDLASGQAAVTGKGNKERLVPLGRIALNWLLRYLQDARPLLVAGAGPDTIFVSHSGRSLDRANLAKIISRHAKRAGIAQHITPHSLRHTCATHLLQAGADIRYIQALLGHNSLMSTQVYTRVDITDLKKVHAAFHPRENA